MPATITRRAWSIRRCVAAPISSWSARADLADGMRPRRAVRGAAAKRCGELALDLVGRPRRVSAYEPRYAVRGAAPAAPVAAAADDSVRRRTCRRAREHV